MNNINKLKAELSGYISLLIYDSHTLVTRYNMLHAYMVQDSLDHYIPSIFMLVPYMSGPPLAVIFPADAKIFSVMWYMRNYTYRLGRNWMYE